MRTDYPFKEVGSENIINDDLLQLNNKTPIRKITITRSLLMIGGIFWLSLWFVGAFILVDHLFHLRAHLFALMVGIFMFLIFAGYYLHNSICPKCGDRFTVRLDGHYNTFTKKCMNCGFSG